MGKPFANELRQIPDTLAWVDDVDVAPIAQFMARTRGEPVISVGAGGSFSTAELTRLLIEARGDLAISQTPLGFLESRIDLRNANVVLFTAGGNNRDVLAAARAAIERECRRILVVCGSTRSKVGGLLQKFPRAAVFAVDLPTGKDGYLATNSLIAFCALVVRAFGEPAVPQDIVKQLLDFPIKSSDAIKASRTFLALYSEWGRPAAVDFESKFSEAGLGNVMPADYRNFAHGRHNWIDKQGEHTTVVAFITPDGAELARKSLALLPSSTRVLVFETTAVGARGSIELLLRVFAFTALIGVNRGIDPGRPGVPPYGSRLYRLGPGYVRHPVANQAAIDRKLAARGTTGMAEDHATAATELGRYCVAMTGAVFHAIVLDFDGTVVESGAGHDPLPAPVTAFLRRISRNGIPIYFATGRGDSIYETLVASFPKSVWERIFVSHYNGAFTLTVAQRMDFDRDCPDIEVLADIHRGLAGNSLLEQLTISARKRCQITVKVRKDSSSAVVSRVLTEVIAAVAPCKARLVQSSHSLDIIPLSSSKLNCVRMAESAVPAGGGVLTIGDRGAYPGNDFDLLTHPYSLSVDTVSSNLNSCWNLLPAGIRNVQGLLHYAKWINVRRGHFTVKIPRVVAGCT